MLTQPGPADLPLRGGSTGIRRLCSRARVLLLWGYLLVWVPATFALELFGTIPSLRMRGWPAFLELGFHAAVAVASATAGYMLLVRAPAGPAGARAVILAVALAAVQSIYWTVLPRDIAPWDRLPLLAAACLTAAFWLVLLGRPSRYPPA